MELRVMVIDDDKIFNLMATILLRNTGITDNPISCTSGQEALALLQKHTAEDTTFLLFLDINMPMMNGWEVLALLEEGYHDSRIYVVMVTSSIDKVDQAKAMAHKRVIDYMVKPIMREKLIALKSAAALAGFFSHR